MAKRMGYKAIFGCESSRYSVQKQVIAIANCQRAKISPKSAPFNLFGNVMKYSKWWKIDWTQFNCISENYLENSANSEQGAQIHQPTGRPVPHTCAHQHGKAAGLLNGENPRLKNPLLPRRVQSSVSSASSTQHMWEQFAGNRRAVFPRHARGRRIMGLVYVCPLL